MARGQPGRTANRPRIAPGRSLRHTMGGLKQVVPEMGGNPRFRLCGRTTSLANSGGAARRAERSRLRSTLGEAAPMPNAINAGRSSTNNMLAPHSRYRTTSRGERNPRPNVVHEVAPAAESLLG